MTPYFESDDVSIFNGDCREVLAEMPENFVDAVVCDPPYDLTSIVKRFGKEGSAPAKGAAFQRHNRGFMGQTWDGTGVAFKPETWVAVLRVLKPGGHLLAFGGSRTYHRMACAVEDAGFELRDTIMWLYGSGFPKSLNVGEGRGTALKPAFEPIILARKPLDGTVAANVLKYGTGALNIDGCRIGYQSEADKSSATPQGAVTARSGRLAGQAQGGGERAEFERPELKGRWPANILHDGSEEVLAGFPDSKGQLAKASTAPGNKTPNVFSPRARELDGAEPRGDSGSAARFFYTAKASKADREEGCDHLPKKSAGELTGGRAEGSDGLNSPRAGAGRTSEGRANTHPTVKPTELMRYLVRLITPPGGLVLDPFMGSGSTGRAARLEGFRFVGIEKESDYIELAKARIVAIKQMRLL